MVIKKTIRNIQSQSEWNTDIFLDIIKNIVAWH